MSIVAHAWTIGRRLRHAVRPLACPESRDWETFVDDPQIGPVRLTGRLHEIPGSEEVLVLVHGLGGSIESHYMHRGAAAAEAEGLSCLRINLRGSDRQGNDYYHAGLTADIHAALASEALRHYRRIHVLGYSLGGHVVLRLATEETDPRVAAVAAVCSPVDLARSQVAIDAPSLWVYRQYLLKNLKRIYAAIGTRRPVPFPVERLGELRTFLDWDDHIVAPRHGFADASDYYARASAVSRLNQLRIPALLVNSEYDPMVPADSVRPALAAIDAPKLRVEWLRTGGHVAFPRRLNAGLGEGTGLDAQVIAWLRSEAEKK